MSHGEVPPWLRAAQEKWTNRGESLPPFAKPPEEGQESVWEYPRPPVLVADPREVLVAFQGRQVARSRQTLRLLETASPPTFYLPPGDVDHSCLRAAPGGSLCEWKGNADYFDVVMSGRVVSQAAWSYPRPFGAFSALAGYFSFYPGRLECWVAGERVRPQPGGFYGGWITKELVGPFKGEPGTQGW